MITDSLLSPDFEDACAPSLPSRLRKRLLSARTADDSVYDSSMASTLYAKGYSIPQPKTRAVCATATIEDGYNQEASNRKHPMSFVTCGEPFQEPPAASEASLLTLTTPKPPFGRATDQSEKTASDAGERKTKKKKKNRKKKLGGATEHAHKQHTAYDADMSQNGLFDQEAWQRCFSQFYCTHSVPQLDRPGKTSAQRFFEDRQETDVSLQCGDTKTIS